MINKYLKLCFVIHIFSTNFTLCQNSHLQNNWIHYQYDNYVEKSITIEQYIEHYDLIKINPQKGLILRVAANESKAKVISPKAVSYTHLTLPTIYSV